MEIVKETTKEKTQQWLTLEKVFALLLGALFTLKGTAVIYQGPIFGTWIGDVCVILIIVAAMLWMRREDQRHTRIMRDMDREIHVARLVNDPRVMSMVEHFAEVFKSDNLEGETVDVPEGKEVW